MKILFTILISLALANPCYAWWVNSGSGPAASGGVCTLGDDGEKTSHLTLEVSDLSVRFYVGQKDYTNDSSVCICKVAFYISSTVGTPSTYDYSAKIWTLDGNNLDTQLGESTAVTGDSWSAEYVDFEFSTCVTISASTAYAITLDNNSSDDSDNYIRTSFQTEDSDALTGVAVRWNTSGVYQVSYGGDMSLRIYWEQ